MTEQTQASVAATGTPKANLSRKTKRKIHRKKMKTRLLADKEFAKGYFDAKSKRSVAKKVAYRRRHAKKTQTTGK